MHVLLGLVMIIAALWGADDKAKDLLHRADQALYRAKHTGRNRVVADAA